MGLGHSPRIVTDGLVLCLDAANARSYPGTGTTWTDRSGNGNHGTLINGTAFDSANGGSLVFDGTNDYVNVPTNDVLDIRGDITLTAWAYKTGHTSFPYFINKSSNNNNLQYLLGWSTGSTIPFHSMGKSIVLNPSNIGIGLNEWVYYAGTRVGDYLTFYINGKIVSGPISLPINSAHTSTANIRIGTLGWTGYSWNGKIGPLSIYNKGLTSEQIRQNYEATKGRYA